MFILDLKSKPSNINYNTEEFTSTSDQVLATNSAHNVNSSEQAASNCPPGVDCSQDTQVGADASQSSVSNIIIDFTVDQLSQINDRCNTQTGVVVRTENGAKYYPGGFANTQFDFNSMCGHSVVRSIRDDPAINPNATGDLDVSVYCDLDCGSRSQTTTNSSTSDLNQNITYVSLTTTAKNTISSQQSEKSEGLSGWEIAGIVIGVLVVVSLIAYFLYVKIYKKNKK